MVGGYPQAVSSRKRCKLSTAKKAIRPAVIPAQAGIHTAMIRRTHYGFPPAREQEQRGQTPFFALLVPFRFPPPLFFFPFRCFTSLRHSAVPLLRCPPSFFPYLPGEPRQCLFYRGPALRANKDATLQPFPAEAVVPCASSATTFYARPRSARSRSRATSQLSPGRACFST
jgi:hypothetical protein